MYNETISAYTIEKWISKFNIEHGYVSEIDDAFIRDFACALRDDIPLGYEASHRLANWLFCYANLNNKNLKSKI